MSSSPLARPTVLAVALGLGSALILTGCLGDGEPIVQPMEFSHATHVQG